MDEPSLSARIYSGVGAGVPGWAAGGWRSLHFSALLVVMALSPSSYSPLNRRRMATQICLTCRQTVPVFTLLSALLSLMLVHIVVVTAESYGLTQYALRTVVRVLVVELLPLSAALFVALRAGAAINAEIAALRQARSERSGAVAESLRFVKFDLIHPIILPRVAGSGVAVVLLATISGGLALLLSYLGVYGFTPWGIFNFTHTVGQVFEPVLILALGLKTLLFAIAVAAIPATAGLEKPRPGQGTSVAVLHGTVRLFAVLIVIEALSLTAEFF